MAVVEVRFEGWEGGGWLDGHVPFVQLIAYIHMYMYMYINIQSGL